MNNFFIIFYCCLLLTGCLNVAVSGANAVYDRHDLQTAWQEHSIGMRAEQAIYLDSNQFNDTHVSVVAFRKKILLVGQTPTITARKNIEQIVRQIANNPPELYNQISIAAPISSMTQASDSWITAKIKSQFIDANEIDPNQIKVVTENGTVYLMGIVSHEMGDIAVDITRNTEGVQNVVRVFSWIYIRRV